MLIFAKKRVVNKPELIEINKDTWKSNLLK
jgi:hypothetical protein